MRQPHVLLGILATALCALGQTDAAMPGVKLLSRIDGGLGGLLVLTDGTSTEFHVEVTAVRARLVDRRMPSDASAHELAIGSHGEAKILGALEQWLAATFPPEEQQELLALDRLPDPRTQDEDYAHQRASLLRTVRLYEQVTRPRITKVFAGRGTVSLSLQLQLGDGTPQQLLWRRFGDDAFARLHLDTDVEPVAIDGRAESRLLLGIANWLGARLGLGSGEALWQPEPADLADDVRLVLGAYRGYLAATSPRLRGAGTVMDSARGGSRTFDISDAQNHVLTVRFDHAAGTKTPGRLRDGGARDAPLVDLGSEREAELLTLLRRTSALRRAWRGAAADADASLQMLTTDLDAYRTTFLDSKAGK